MKRGPGRPRGSRNKLPIDIKAMIEGALDDLGGQAWLVKQARKNPRAFFGLIGRCLPRDLKVSGEIKHTLEQLIAASYEQPADTGHAQASGRPH